VNNQSSLPLLHALQQCVARDHAPFYTPGHKRGRGSPDPLIGLLGSQVLRADLTELPDLDTLFAPTAAIQAAQALAAAAFGSDRTWFLVNGSTCGVMAAILATCAPGEKVILPRNCHQSAISGLILSGAMPVFVDPEYDANLDRVDGIPPAAIAAALQHNPDASAVLLVSPTYEGVCSDVGAIATLCHQQGIPLLVDEAHGAHFAFHPQLPTPALAAGADLAVQSTHKTLAAMTQAAMLHLQGNRVDPERIHKALTLVQSSSPSFVLLASLDAARWQMATQGQALLDHTLTLAERARSQLAQIPSLAVLSPAQARTPGFVALDPTRLTVTVSGLGIDGFTVDELLRQQGGVTAELPALQHLTFILSLGNTEADVERLLAAFRALPDQLAGQPESPPPPATWQCDVASRSSPPVLSPREAFFTPVTVVPVETAIARISAELVCPYPPGIPVLMPGEVVTEAAIAHLQRVLAAGGMLTGCADATLKTVRVVDNQP